MNWTTLDLQQPHSMCIYSTCIYEMIDSSSILICGWKCIGFYKTEQLVSKELDNRLFLTSVILLFFLLGFFSGTNTKALKEYLKMVTIDLTIVIFYLYGDHFFHFLVNYSFKMYADICYRCKIKGTRLFCLWAQQYLTVFIECDYEKHAPSGWQRWGKR